MIPEIKYLEEKAKDLRKKTFDLALQTDLAHFGGSFSIIELLVSLYEVILKKEDKFILSKGHGCPPWYVILKERGFNPHLSGHPDIDPENGIYCTTGSLGHGLPMGIGMAMTRKFKNENGHIYVLMSDGEYQEGTTWESLLIASKYKLDNLTAIIDYNKIQASDFIENVLPLNNLRKKIEAFNWHITEINGHSYHQIIDALSKKELEKPHMIIANTIKGNGISFMENSTDWHSKRPTDEQFKQAYRELK